MSGPACRRWLPVARVRADKRFPPGGAGPPYFGDHLWRLVDWQGSDGDRKQRRIQVTRSRERQEGRRRSVDPSLARAPGSASGQSKTALSQVDWSWLVRYWKGRKR